MKIGIDVSQTGNNKAGCGYLAYNLVKSFSEIDEADEFLLYPTFGDFFYDPDWNKSTIRIDKPNFKRGVTQNSLERAHAFWAQPTDDFESQLGSPDIVQAMNYYCPRPVHQSRLVYTLADLAYLTHPEWTTEANRLGCFTGVFQASLQADFIVMISEYTRNQFHHFFPHYPLERTCVVPLGSRYLGVPEPKPTNGVSGLISDRFWLNVGTLEPRKNQMRLLQAYAELKTRHANTGPLVIAGGKGWLMDDFEQTVQKLGLEKSVTWLGYVDENTLQWLYRNCYAFIYPSLLEGFGLPVLEAMSQAAAVITSNTSSLPEVMGDAGLQVDPTDIQALYLAMEKFVENEPLRQQLKQKGLARAAEFSWEQTARKTLEVYNTVLQMDKLAS